MSIAIIMGVVAAKKRQEIARKAALKAQAPPPEIERQMPVQPLVPAWRPQIAPPPGLTSWLA